MKEAVPFIINSNIITSGDSISDFSSFMNSVNNNTGHSYITYSLIKECFNDIKTLHHIQNIYTYDFDNQDKDIDFINNVATHVVFVLQDQIRLDESYGLQLPYEKIMNFIKRINKPIIIAGFGANYITGYNSNFYKELSPELVQFLRFLSEHCIEIGVRGYITQEVFDKLGIKNTRAIGCPTYFETGRNRIVTKQCINNIEEILLISNTLLTDNLKNNFQIVQDLLETKYIKAICYSDFEDDFTDYEINKLIKQKYHIFSNIEDWKNFIKNFKFAIGNRVHGAIIAINAGVPAICTNPDARATEMCEFMGIPHNPDVSQDTNIIDLYNELDVAEMNKKYNSVYVNFIDFLKVNNVIESVSINTNNLLEFPSPILYKKGYTFKLFCALFNKKIKILNGVIDSNINNIEYFINSIIRVIKFKIATFFNF